MRGPSLEIRPTGGVVFGATAENHFRQSQLPVGGLMIGAVLKRVGDAVFVPWTSAVDAAAQKVERHVMDVIVDVAAHTRCRCCAFECRAVGTEIGGAHV